MKVYLMTEPKPYLPPDFQAEQELHEKTESRIQKLTKIAAAQQKGIRKRYEEETASLKKTHQEEIARITKESNAQGHRQGHQQGLDESRQSVEKALSDLEAMSQKIVDSEKAFLRNAEKHIVSLALAVAKKIIGREVKSDKDLVVYTIRESLKLVTDKTRITVLVNPDELENVLSHRRELQEIDRDLPEMEFVPDDRIEPGGCIVETRTGAVDGRMESQLEEIERNFSKDW